MYQSRCSGASNPLQSLLQPIYVSNRVSISRQDGAYLAIVIIVDVLGAVKPAINCYSGYLRTAHETHNVGGLSQ